MAGETGVVGKTRGLLTKTFWGVAVVGGIGLTLVAADLMFTGGASSALSASAQAGGSGGTALLSSMAQGGQNIAGGLSAGLAKTSGLLGAGAEVVTDIPEFT